MDDKIKIEIWSDVACPFCYIGKKEFEKALSGFSKKELLDIEWKSYQLAPDMTTDTGKSLAQSLADAKGISLNDASQMFKSVSERAASVGLKFNMDKAVPANTHNAHTLIQFAKKAGKQSEAEELLFRAHFTEGKNVDDIPTLLALGEALGFDRHSLEDAISNRLYDTAIDNDIDEAFQLGVRGVPFFVFERKYAVSGAQPSEVFRNTLEKISDEWEKANFAVAAVKDGSTCNTDGTCN